ncbi:MULTISPECIES: hypothetical protein [unclassified Methylosinus]|uniref:hypothetical protein n=1 Tax=unclassified Methylosinus TaxID=2624500 RepID=UPI001416F763|nr:MULTISPECIES: hypothetical protein [unclassified Methylosinus]
MDEDSRRDLGQLEAFRAVRDEAEKRNREPSNSALQHRFFSLVFRPFHARNQESREQDLGIALQFRATYYPAVSDLKEAFRPGTGKRLDGDTGGAAGAAFPPDRRGKNEETASQSLRASERRDVGGVAGPFAR